MQAGVTCTNVSNYTAWKWQLEKMNHDLAPELTTYTLMRSFSYASHQCGHDSLTPNCHIYTVAGGSQYYGHLRPTPEGSVRWYARRASSMCMCMSPRARWKMVHRSYLYMLSVSVMQAGVTCTNVSNYTAWKWQLEKKNHNLAPELTAYTLTRSFSYASHQCGRNSLTPNCHIYTVAGGLQYYGHLRPTPEGSVRWYARWASSMCMCMSPRARWKMVHRSYLYMLSVSVMQAGVTCTNVSNYTAWKWQLEKKNHDLAPELATYTLTRSFSYASHQCGRDSLTPNCHIYTVKLHQLA